MILIFAHLGGPARKCAKISTNKVVVSYKRKRVVGPESRKTVIYSLPDHGYILLNWPNYAVNRGKIPAFMNWLPTTGFYV